MALRIFGDKAKLKVALNTRFGAASQTDIDAAKVIVDSASAASWTSADLKARTAEIKNALGLLEKGDAEAKVRYVSASADLQISKASGLVTYCALLCAIGAMMFQAPYLQSQSGVLIAVASAIAVLASLFTLCALWFRWPKNESDLATAEGEVNWLIDLLLSRARLLNIAVLLAIVSTVTLATGAWIWTSERTQEQQQSEDQSDTPVQAIVYSVSKLHGVA